MKICNPLKAWLIISEVNKKYQKTFPYFQSTAVHAKLICPENVRLFTFPEMGDYSDEENTFLVFPGKVYLRKLIIPTNKTYP